MAAAKRTTVDAPEVEHVIQEPITEAIVTGWDYAYIQALNTDAMLAKLNAAGQAGWEVISVEPYHGIAWLKRQIVVTPPVEEAATDTIVADAGSES